MFAEQFNPAWLADPEVFSVNQLPACSDHEIFASAEERESSLVRSLNGTWRAHFAMNPGTAPDCLLTDGSSDASLEAIEVPCEFQLLRPDWDPPHYVNVQYPWDGHEALVPPQVSELYNPTVTAVRRFTVEEQELRCGRAVLTFEGVEAAVAVWLNGRFVGYAEDSFTPHRFDVTAVLQAGENRLVARVFKRCTGTWMEDQDFWRFSGIHRDVTLTFEPAVHLADLFIRTPLEEQYTRAFLEADLTLDRPQGTVQVQLTDPSGAVLLDETLDAAAALSLRREIPGVRLWSAEEPCLYPLTVTLRDAQGAVVEVSRLQVGFRQFEMIDKVMCLNGRRIVFHGVNRHEFDCDRGRVMTRELLLHDLRDMKGMNVNAIRTCHYPNNSMLYRLCDQYGFYVIDETNIETHGTWAREDRGAGAVPGSRPDWLEAVLARGRAMQERDKNHPCILLWSCGNESWFGEDLLALSNLFRRRDPTRLVHYEGCWPSEQYSATSDVYSRMYYKVADIENYLNGNPQKPFINCEYTHAMGNSCGGMCHYRDLEDRYPMYQGGFIWDYVDQALRVKNINGKTRLAYGGDFGDKPNDWHFNTNGIILGDRTLTPKVQEIRQLFADVTLIPDLQGVEVRNRKVFAPLKGYELRWRALYNRETWEEGIAALPEIPAGGSAHVQLPLEELAERDGEIILTAWLVTAQEGLLPKGFALSFGQTVFGELPAAAKAESLPWILCDHNLGVRKLGVLASRGEGIISLRDALGRETLLRAPLLSLFRAPTDNDRGNKDALRQGIWHLVSRYSRMSSAEVEGDTVTWRYTNETVPGMDLSLSLTPQTDGLCFRLHWRGTAGLPDLPAFGLSLQMDPRLHEVTYFGAGPDENYADRCRGAWLDWHRYDSRTALTRYAKPQECANRRQVSVLRLTDETGHGVELTGENLEVHVLPYLPEEIGAVWHPDELGETCRTVLDVALFRKGVGGDDSWGAPVLPAYTYPSDRDWTLTFKLRGI